MNESDREKTCLPLIESAPTFAGVPPAALRFVAGGCHTRTGSRGRVLCERGQTLDGFHVLVSCRCAGARSTSRRCSGCAKRPTRQPTGPRAMPRRPRRHGDGRSKCPRAPG